MEVPWVWVSEPLFTKRARAQSLPLFSDPSMELPAYETDQSDSMAEHYTTLETSYSNDWTGAN